MLHWSVQGCSTGSPCLPWRRRTFHRTSASTRRLAYSAAIPTRSTSFKSSSLWHRPRRS
uniref:Uncharacterized protein n=1 Tax=Arundo donax TaxID=35708 RepID=A0A0A9EUJ9_ARUDO